MNRKRQSLDDNLLLEINQLATHWHRQIGRLFDDGLNGSFDSILANAVHTEERLDGLWLRRRRQMAQPDAVRFKDEMEQYHESVFEDCVHIGTCS